MGWSGVARASQTYPNDDVGVWVFNILICLAASASLVTVVKSTRNAEHIEERRLQAFAQPAATVIGRSFISFCFLVMTFSGVLAAMYVHPAFWLTLCAVVAVFGAYVRLWIRSRGLPAVVVEELAEQGC